MHFVKKRKREKKNRGVIFQSSLGAEESERVFRTKDLKSASRVLPTGTSLCLMGQIHKPLKH